jgi:hypothetical protein
MATPLDGNDASPLAPLLGQAGAKYDVARRMYVARYDMIGITRVTEAQTWILRDDGNGENSR